MTDQNDKEFTATNPVDFTDALKWYAIAKEKQKDYDDAIQKLKAQMDENMRLRREANQARQDAENAKAEAKQARTNQIDKQNGAAYLVDLLNRAGRNVRELRVVLREPDPWEDDE